MIHVVGAAARSTMRKHRIVVTEEEAAEATRGPYAFDPNKSNALTILREDNRVIWSTADNTDNTTIAEWDVSTGKWYWELEIVSMTDFNSVGVCDQDTGTNFDETDRVGWDESWGFVTNESATPDEIGFYHNGVEIDNVEDIIYTEGDILGFALDMNNNKLWLAVNNSWIGSGDPENGTNPQFEDVDIDAVISAACSLRYNGDMIRSRFNSGEQSYSPPTGFSSIGTESFTVTDEAQAWDPDKINSDITLSDNNRLMTAGANGTDLTAISYWYVNSGKWYWEIELTSIGGSYESFGICSKGSLSSNNFTKDTRSGWNESWALMGNGRAYHNGSYSNVTGFSNGQTLGFALDVDNHKLWFAVNNSWIESGDPENGTNPVFDDATMGTVICACGTLRYRNTRCKSCFNSDELNYTPPTGFSAISEGSFS